MKMNNIEKIALKANVSPTTVSRYYNHPHKLSEKTRQKIEKVISENGYRLNSMASFLAKGETNIIGIILPNLNLSFFSELLNKIIEEGKKIGYSCITYTSDNSREEEITYINKLLDYNVKGIIVLSHLLSSNDLQNFGTKIITIERESSNLKAINSDNYMGGKLAAELLIKNNCDSFFHINNDYQEAWPSFKRIVGFEFALKNYDYKTIIENNLTNPNTKEAKLAMDEIMNRIIKTKGKIGIFCSNDNIAVLVENWCMVNNVNIPEKVEIVGYDNSPISNLVPFPISSVDQNINLMAKVAIESIDSYTPTETIVPAELIVKSTTSS